MKKLSTLLVSLILFSMTVGAQVTERCFHLDKVQFLQQRQDFWRSHTLYSTTARPLSMISGGYYNLTEFNYGFGLRIRTTPFANNYAGITTVNGWRFGGGLAVGVGVGYLKYNTGMANTGWMLPVYADGRYYFGSQKNKFFAMLSGGMLFNFEDFKANTRYFFNPGLGLTIPLTKNSQLSFAAGLFTQYDYNFFSRIPDAGIRDSFINMKLGLLFGK